MLKKIVAFYLGSHFAVVFSSIVIGVFFAEWLLPLSHYSTVVLGMIFFLSALKIDFESLLHDVKDVKLIVVVIIMSLFVFPVFVFFTFNLIFPALAVPMLILFAMPNGMTTPVLTDIVGGKVSLALILAVTASLLAPFTIPLLIKMFAGATVSMSLIDMFLKIAKVIFIPFAIAQVVKYFVTITAQHKAIFKPISMLLIGILTASLVAKQADVLIEGMLSGYYVIHLVLITCMLIIVHFLGYYSVYWKKGSERIAVVVGLVYMNIALGIFIADEFFGTPEIVAPIVLAVLPWALLLQPFAIVVKRLGLLNR